MNEDNEELEALINQIDWLFIGKGGFNLVGRSVTVLTIGGYTGQWVYKLQQKENQFSNSARAVRKWNTINPGLPAFKTKQGWIAPYVGNKQATDLQIARKLISIYRLTGNIIADACVKKNFLQFKGKTICVDFDYAIRRCSHVSQGFDRSLKILSHIFEEYASAGYSTTVTIIKNLFYLEEFRSTIQDYEQYINFRFILNLTDFREHGLTMDSLKLDMLALVIALDSEKELHDKLLGSFYINQLVYIHVNDSISSKEQLFRAYTKIISALQTGGALFHLLADVTQIIELKFLVSQNPALLETVTDKGSTLLHYAVRQNNSEMVVFLLSRTRGHTVIKASKSSAFDVAISYGHYDVAMILYNAGVSPSSQTVQSVNYLFFAAYNGLLSLLRSLIKESPARLNSVGLWRKNALFYAASNEQTIVVQYLIQQGIDLTLKEYIKGYTALDWAIEKAGRATIQLLRDAAVPTTVTHDTIEGKTIHQLVSKNDFEAFKLLLDINPSLATTHCNKGYPVLLYAAASKRLEFVQCLIEKGANPEIAAIASSHQYSQWSPLDMAIDQKRKAIVDYLTTSASLVPYLHNRQHAMIYAAAEGMFPFLKQLVQFEPELIHFRDRYNQMPILHASAMGHQAIVVYLIHAGSELNEASQDAMIEVFHEPCERKNYTPLDWAIFRNQKAVMRTLLLAGAKTASLELPADMVEKKQESRQEKISLFMSFFRRKKTDEVNDPRASCASRDYGYPG